VKVGKPKNMKKIIILLTVLLVNQSNAQQKFITAGKIEYEMKKNQHKQLEDEENNESEWIKELKKNMPKFIIETYSLRFNETKSVYKLEKENADNKYLWGGKPSETDITIQDIKLNRVSLQRDVYEKTYLVQDSIRQLDWRITDETRDIAGFECRKAVSKICDSVYIVAFYTDQIPVSAGPESFGGLPGMILGLAVPRLAMTWFATKLELTEPTLQELSPAQKGKKSDWKGMETDMKKALKDWGKYGDRQMWRLLL
jgi:GLPGLI family protein